MNKNKKGFTLIELLIAITIIGILSSFLLSNFVSARQRARDTQRKSDIHQIQSALELYRSDQGTYPPTLSSNGTVCGSGSTLANNGTTYMQTIPCDPLGNTYYNSGPYAYVPANGNATYTIGACLENGNDLTAQTNPGNLPNGCATSGSGKFFVVNNP